MNEKGVAHIIWEEEKEQCHNLKTHACLIKKTIIDPLLFFFFFENIDPLLDKSQSHNFMWPVARGSKELNIGTSYVVLASLPHKQK